MLGNSATAQQHQAQSCRSDFGMLLSQVVVKTARLLNVSLERARFTVHRPKPPLQVSCASGPLAAGMHMPIKVTLTGAALGDFEGFVKLTSELNIFSIKVTARILPSMSSLESQDSLFPGMSLNDIRRASLTPDVKRGSLTPDNKKASLLDTKPQ